jgi:hypothetical protein
LLWFIDTERVVICSVCMHAPVPCMAPASCMWSPLQRACIVFGYSAHVEPVQAPSTSSAAAAHAQAPGDAGLHRGARA